LGKGAHGKVYRGVDEKGHNFAIKQVALSNISHDHLASIHLEINLLKKLNHPNIVKYIGEFIFSSLYST
jgi:serine/threonine protein kinase